MIRRRQRVSWFQKYKKYIYVGCSAVALGISAFAITIFTLSDNKGNVAPRDSVIVEEYAYKKDESSIRLNPEAIKKTEVEQKQETEQKNIEKVIHANKVEEKNIVEVSAKPIKKEITFIFPLEGDIIMEYAKDKLVYSKTLEEWTTHYGIDIKGDEATPVKASAAGKVKDKKVDPRFGNTIIIEHENGYKTIYSNLSTLDLVEINEEIEQGDIISGVGVGYGFEMEEGPHIHFEILENGENINPVEKI